MVLHSKDTIFIIAGGAMATRDSTRQQEQDQKASLLENPHQLLAASRVSQAEILPANMS